MRPGAEPVTGAARDHLIAKALQQTSLGLAVAGNLEADIIIAAQAYHLPALIFAARRLANGVRAPPGAVNNLIHVRHVQGMHARLVEWRVFLGNERYTTSVDGVPRYFRGRVVRPVRQGGLLPGGLFAAAAGPVGERMVTGGFPMIGMTTVSGTTENSRRSPGAWYDESA